MNYWLIKSEASCYSIDDLKKDKKTAWVGVRNYQARNFMVSGMQVGDKVLFYCSKRGSSKRVTSFTTSESKVQYCTQYHSLGTDKTPAGVYGVARVASPAHADETQFDKHDEHYDPKAIKPKGKDVGKVIWQCVDMAYVSKFKHPVTLAEMRLDPACAGMALLAPGQRLSIMPVSEKHFNHILKLSDS